MDVEGYGLIGRAGAALLAALALGGCGSTGFISKSADIFNFPQNPVADANAKASLPNTPGTGDFDCPEVSIRNGASTLIIGSKPGGEPSALDLRYQGTITKTARECHVNSGLVTIKVGIEGRVITGPAGGPGTVDVPLRIAVVQEGVQPKTIMSKLSHVQVTVTGTFDRPTFTLVDPDIAFPIPVPLAAIDSYVVYVGFDPLGAQAEKPTKKPRARRRTKPAPQLRPAVRPGQS